MSRVSQRATRNATNKDIGSNTVAIMENITSADIRDPGSIELRGQKFDNYVSGDKRDR